MNVSVFIATSLDGYIARKNGSIDWLLAADPTGGAEDYGYQGFFDSIDCMVMGRKSLETVMEFPEWPYPNKRVIVLSHTLKDAPAPALGKIELFAGPIHSLYAELKNQAYQRLYVDGGKTVQSFLREGLVNDLTITRIPILLGEGIPLFGSLPKDVKLKHLSTQAYASGFVQSRYEIENTPR